MSESSLPDVPSRPRLWAALIENTLERFWVRLGLSVAIIVSLLPAPWAQRFDLLFLAIFGTEFLLRLGVMFMRMRDPPGRERLGASPDASIGEERVGARRRFATFALLTLDFLALMSFLPLALDAEGARWLRLFRLTRMLLLFGYWAPIVLDLWAVLARRERARQLVLMGVVVAGLSFAGAVLLYYVGGAEVDVNDDGIVTSADRSFVALLWWSFRQVQDPGNMLASPQAVPVLVISLLLTVFGLFLVSFLIGLGTDVVHELLELTRLRPPGLRGHTVVVNITPSTRRLLHELMRYYRKLLPTDAPLLSRAWFRDLRRRGFGGPRYLIVGNQPEPPEFLRQPELSRIVYRERPADEEALIRRADLLTGKRIVLLADETDSDPDAETIRTLLTLVERVRDKERRGDAVTALGRRRAVIAEILDESNVPAAQAALATGTRSFRGFVVPTERLLALFFASVVRRPGLGRLLEELLTSHGHEIYTCFFETEGMGFVFDDPPSLGTSASGAMDRLLAHGLKGHDGGCIIPLGLLVHADAPPGGRDFEVWVNPREPREAERDFRGFVAIADNFRSIWSLASRLPKRLPAADDAEPPAATMPILHRTHRRKTTRILVCGFRPGSIYMLEELFRSDPGGQVLVLVADEAARQEALRALDGHSELVRRGLMHGRHGTFERQVDGSIVFRLSEDGPPALMHLRVADWMASRHLVDLPVGFGHVADLDAMIFVAADRERADKRTTTALLKLEQLFSGRTARPRVVAEVIDGKLAQRLEQRCRELEIADVRVFSIQELRAYFLFQSVVVPGFDTVYAELLGSWGQSFVHKHVVPGENESGHCDFAALALSLREGGEILIAVELEGPDGHLDLCVAPKSGKYGARFDVSALRGVWVVAPDSSRSGAAARTAEASRAAASAREPAAQ